MNASRVAHAAFLISGISVVLSIPAASVFQNPDMPAVVLVLSGGAATLLSITQLAVRRFQILVALILLTGGHIVLHRLWHRLGVQHDWQGVLYVSVLLVYCVLALKLGAKGIRLRPT